MNRLHNSNVYVFIANTLALTMMEWELNWFQPLIFSFEKLCILHIFNVHVEIAISPKGSWTAWWKLICHWFWNDAYNSKTHQNWPSMWGAADGLQRTGRSCYRQLYLMCPGCANPIFCLFSDNNGGEEIGVCIMYICIEVHISIYSICN